MWFTNNTMILKYSLSGFALILATFGGSPVVKYFINPFYDQKFPQGFINAGNLIGILERFLIFLFLLLKQYELIGFIITAKAIYRFGDIQGTNDIKMKLSEYFILGTFLSLIWVFLIYSLLVISINVFV